MKLRVRRSHCVGHDGSNCLGCGVILERPSARTGFAHRDREHATASAAAAPAAAAADAAML
jgi:hypothetical protein